VFAGCTRNKSFVNIGHDTAVPGAKVEAYARAYNVSEAEALKRILGGREDSKESASAKPARPASAGKIQHTDP
jgi:hypothetical protein